MDTFISRALDLAQSTGVQYADIRVVENRTESMQVKNGVVESLNFAESRGFGVRVLVDGAWGFSSSHDLTTEEIDRVTRHALEIARSSGLVGGGRRLVVVVVVVLFAAITVVVPVLGGIVVDI